MKFSKVVQKRIGKFGVTATGLTVLVSTILAMSAVAAAGGSDRGGGDLVLNCSPNPISFAALADFVSGPSVREVSEVPVGVIYDNLLAGLQNGVDTPAANEMTESAVLALTFDYISGTQPVESQQVKAELDSLTFIPVAPSAVPTLDTGFSYSSFEMAFGKGCVRQQLAVQDFTNHKVYYKSLQGSPLEGVLEYYDSLGPVGKAFFHLHEAYLRWAYDQGNDMKTSETIARNKLGTIINSVDFGRKLIAYAFPIDMDSLQYNRYLVVWDEAFDELHQDTATSLFHWISTAPKRTLQTFAKALSEIGLHCAMNADAVNAINHIDGYKIEIDDNGAGDIFYENNYRGVYNRTGTLSPVAYLCDPKLNRVASPWSAASGN